MSLNVLLADVCVVNETIFDISNGMPQIKSHFREIGVHSDVKYIDPTYMLRAVRANASDAILCTVLGQNAVRHCFSFFSLQIVIY
jgi:6-phosphofructokinase 1